MISLMIWLAIGAAIAVYLYRTMNKEGKVEMIWVLIGFLFSVLGLLAFIGLRSMKEKERDKAVDPKSYEPPAYRIKGPEGEERSSPPSERAAPESKPKKEIKQIEGIPRCPECGSAISSSDKRCNDCGAKLKD